MEIFLFSSWTLSGMFQSDVKVQTAARARTGFPTKLRGHRERSMLAEAQQFSAFSRETNAPVGGSRKTRKGIYRCCSLGKRERAVYSLCLRQRRRFARRVSVCAARSRTHICEYAIPLPLFLTRVSLYVTKQCACDHVYVQETRKNCEKKSVVD